MRAKEFIDFVKGLPANHTVEWDSPFERPDGYHLGWVDIVIDGVLDNIGHRWALEVLLPPGAGETYDDDDIGETTLMLPASHVVYAVRADADYSFVPGAVLAVPVGETADELELAERTALADTEGYSLEKRLGWSDQVLSDAIRGWFALVCGRVDVPVVHRDTVSGAYCIPAEMGAA